MIIATALGMTNEQFVKLLEENQIESNFKRQRVRNEQKAI